MDVHETLIGQTIVKIDHDRKQMTFILEDGRKFQFHHVKDCCEEVFIKDISGDLGCLIGYPLLMAEEVTQTARNDEICESSTWTFYKFATAKGYVTISWLGTSNGYYSEEVDFDQI